MKWKLKTLEALTAFHRVFTIDHKCQIVVGHATIIIRPIYSQYSVRSVK